MGIMKLCLVFLLCMLAMKQWIPCEASRKMLMEEEVEGNGGFLHVSRKILLEEGEEANNLETELLLPDETEGENLEVEQQEPLGKLEKKKHKEDESMLPESRDGDLLVYGSQDEKAAGEKTQKKKKKKEYGNGGSGEGDILTEQESTGQLMGENLREEEEGERDAKKKARNDMESSSIPGETLEEDLSFKMGKEGDEAEGLLGEASLSDNAEIAMETGGEAVLSEGGGDKDGRNTSEEKSQATSDLVLNQNKHQASIDDAQRYNEEDAKEKSSKPKKSKKKEVEGAVKADTDEVSKSKAQEYTALKGEAVETTDEVEEAVKANKEKADTDGGSKGKAQDDKALKGEAVVEEPADEVTPADVIEREMQGGVEDLVTQAVEEKIVEEKGQAKEEAGISMTKEQGSSDESKQTEGGKAKKKSLKKPKTLKQPKSEGQVLEEESKGSKSIDEESMEARAEASSDLQLKPMETQDTAKPKTKKKKKVKSSEKAEKEGKSSEKKVMQSSDNKTKVGTKDGKLTEAKHDKKVPRLETSSKVAIAEEDTNKKKQSEVEKASRGTKDELPTVEKQEEKLEVEGQSIAKDAQERAEGFISTKTLSAKGVDADDDEYDFLQDFSDVSTNFQDTALKVADHLGPNIQKLTDTSKVYFNKANQQITESFSPVVGKQFAPFFASLVSYGLLLVPLAVVVLLFEHIRALLSLQKVLLFVNIYLAAYFATLLLATFVLGEPMNFFYKSSASGYVHMQLLQALGYIVYLVLQTFDLVFTLTSETVPIKITAVLQWLVAFTVGFHYYVTIFHRAMALKGPHTNWKIYGVYSIAFLVLCLFARIKRVKKGYTQLGQADTDKKH